VQSARWAAWADARGFPAEFGRSAPSVQRRLSDEPAAETFGWTRRVGGRLGPTVRLPAGTYSDDTQLRLATSRCIRSTGRFDVECFSKIELPVFLAYGLGMGRGTRAAAQHLGRRTSRWNSNFFDVRASRYVEGGGNGAAMRIQPHVWASRGGDDQLLPDVLRNAVTTHGHPRGILGAAFHALSLRDALRSGTIPAPHDWNGLVQRTARVPEVMSGDEALVERWIPFWEQATGRPWPRAAAVTANEIEQFVATAARASAASGSLADRYERLCARLGAFDPESRGAGHLSAVLALWLAWEGRDRPLEALVAAAELRGSDTDTIATMAGAILGTTLDFSPPGSLLDDALHEREATRLWSIGRGADVDDFTHPDQLRWEAPVTQSDVVGSVDGTLAIAGLGPATAIAEADGDRGDGFRWQWLRLSFGQTILAKRRETPPALDESQLPVASARKITSPRLVADARPARASHQAHVASPSDIERAVDLVVASRFDAVLIGRLTTQFARMEHGANLAAAFAGLVANRLRVAERDA